MPIVDGLNSTKMIRSYEKTHSNIYSPRAALCGRIPIIAVSASLLERDRQQYIDAGFDAWILKPISFNRLNQLMSAVVDTKIRVECLYQPGAWENGGWFHTGVKRPDGAATKPSGEPPGSYFAEAIFKATSSHSPIVGEGSNEDNTLDEQQHLPAQDKGKEKAQDEQSSEEPPT